MNTGIQRSGGTPRHAWTMTTPSGSPGPKKDIDAILEAHHIAYQATATPSFPEDMVRKFEKARSLTGFRFLHILAPCPPGWKHDAQDTVGLSRLAVRTGLFPLFEIEQGRFKLNVPVPKRRPVGDFLRPQGRFRGMSTQDESLIQEDVDKRWRALEARGS